MIANRLLFGAKELCRNGGLSKVKRWLQGLIPLLVLSGSSVGDAAWKEEWQKVLKAAKKEGTAAGGHQDLR